MKQFRPQWPLTVLLIFIGCLYLSYYPLIMFGSQDGVHLDGSLLYGIALAAMLSSLGVLWKHRQRLWQNKAWLLLVSFSSYATLSILWSPNPFRAALTAAFLWLVVGVSTVMAVQFPELVKRRAIVQYILIGGLLVSCGWAVWQVIGDALGVHPAYTLLPESYRSSVFGFARPTAFALEPQFFASLLLVPFGWFLYKSLVSPLKKAPSLGLALSTCMLLLTMSRGGLLAGSVIAITLFALLIRRHWKKSLPLIATFVGGAMIALLIMFASASLNHRDTISGRDALARSVNHLSLGVLTLPEEKPRGKTTKAATSTAPTSSTEGYVESSTTSRLSMSQKALSIWNSEPLTTIFGIGIGGFGKALHEQDRSQPVSSVVNNYFLEMIAELGVVGFVLFAGFMSYLLYRLAIYRQLFLFALIVGFLAQWCFFSGNANVIHVWAIIGIALAVSYVPPRKPHLLQ